MTTSQALRKRNMTAALRLLKLIRDAVLAHLDILEGGGVPESSFTVHAAKYAETLAVLHALDALGDDGNGDDEDVCVSREGLTALIGLLRASDVGYAIADAEEGSPLGSILEITGTGEPEPGES